jgi:SAM-dependent methyltransferase
MIFVPRTQLLNEEEEKSRYDLHENHIRSKGYEKFLRRLINPIKELCTPESLGLDFGEGPYPMLRELFAEDGYSKVQGYDPYYNQNEEVLSGKYDFVTCSEVIEHTKSPIDVLQTINNLLKSNGYLAMSTGVYSEGHDFLAWQYTHDDTHINFFTEAAILWVSKTFSLEIKQRAKDLVIFLKK